VPRIVLASLLVLVGCTSTAARPLRPLDTRDAAIAWQVRCGQTIWDAATAAGDPRLADAEVVFHTWHGDNYTYYAVNLKARSPEALTLVVDRKDPPIRDDHAEGWQREVVASRVRLRRDDGITRAELGFPESAAATVEPTRALLAAAVDACIAEPLDGPG